ncbi:MAG: murein biosynthesis integral membrane protein MurJ [Desulfitobacteriia bacterium]|jgi:putative peptidoglycan lipid II flippase
MELKSQSTIKAVGTVTLLTVLAKLFSLWNTQTYLTHFGTGPYVEMYTLALSLPLIIFNGLGTALTVVVIPIFAGYLGKSEEGKAHAFLNNLISLMVLATIILSLVGIALSPTIIKFTRFGQIDAGFGAFALAVMFPIIIFYSLNYILQGVLQSYQKYNMPAIVSIPYSLTVILYVYLLGDKFGVRGLVIATFIGLSLQALILIPPARRQGYRYRPSFNYQNEDIRKAFSLMLPVIFGTAAYQVNMLFGNLLATGFPSGIVILTTVYNLTLVMSLSYIYSLTAVYFPRFSVLAAKNDLEGIGQNLTTLLKVLIFTLLPAAVGLSLIGEELIDLIYGYGKFTPADVKAAGLVMALYSLGIIGIGLKEVIDRVFYSLQDTKTPILNGVLVAATNISVTLILIRFLEFKGIALGYSISVLAGGLMMLYLSGRRLKNLDYSQILSLLLKTGLACLIMALAVILTAKGTASLWPGTAVHWKFIRLILPVTAGGVTYFLAAYFLGIKEAKEFIAAFSRRIGLR